jgi:hypothetical protein
VEFDWKNIDVDPESMNDELRQYVRDHFPDAVFPDPEDDLSFGKILSGRLGIGESEDDEENSESEEEDDEGAADDGIDYYHPSHEQGAALVTRRDDHFGKDPIFTNGFFDLAGDLRVSRDDLRAQLP